LTKAEKDKKRKKAALLYAHAHIQAEGKLAVGERNKNGTPALNLQFRLIFLVY